MLKIRLSRNGCKKKPFFKVVLSDSRKPRDGKFIEKIGFYDPFSKKYFLNIKKIKDSIKNGAKPTKPVLYLINEFIKNNKN